MTAEDLRKLLTEPEGERIEFKPGILNRSEIAEYAVGIGNAGGGWLIMGVTDKRPRRICGMTEPNAEELARIRSSVADSTHIHLALETIRFPEGCVLVAHVPSRPRGTPFHTRTGKYLIRVDDGLRGMTLPELDAIRREAGVEFTAQSVPGNWQTLVRPAGLEELRALMREANAPADLLKLGDDDLLRALGVLRDDGQLLLAGLLLVGQSSSLREHAPQHLWQFFRMVSDTDYDQPDSGNDCLTIALKRLRDHVNANNPVVTFKHDLVHPEFPRYPALALRELLVNALVHRDYQAPGAVTVKLFPDRLEISNPGGFLGDITPANILHHPSTPRYRTLFDALTRIRLANAANLGVPRVYRDLLIEGKEPPCYWTTGQTVSVVVKAQDARAEFIALVRQHDDLRVDELLVLQYLTRHREISVGETAHLCQRSLDAARETLAGLTNRRGLLERGGTGKGRYYRLSRPAYGLLSARLAYHVDRRLVAENLRARVMAALEERPLSNAELREITQMERQQVRRLMKSLESEGVCLIRKGRASLWMRKPTAFNP